MSAALADGGQSDPLSVCVADNEGDDASGMADTVVPRGWRREIIPARRWLEWADSPPPDRRILLVAPFVSTREALGMSPDELREDGWRGPNTLVAVMLARAVRRAQPGQRIAALAPSTAFASSYADLRKGLLGTADLHLLVEFDGVWAQTLGMHQALRLSLFCFERRAAGSSSGPARFLKVTRGDPEGDVTKELRLLLGQGGGRTNNGFVQREPLDTDRALQYAAFDPARQERQAALRTLGEVQPLGELVSIHRGTINRTLHAKELGKTGIAVLTGRDLRTPGPIADFESVRVRRADDAALLQAGDICLAGMIRSGERLRVRRLSSHDLPLVADHNILVLRPGNSLDETHAEFLVDYLGSERAAALLAHETTGGLHLRPKQLRELLVPLADESLRSALDDLRQTERQLQTWAMEVQTAINGILGDTTDDTGVLRLRSTGQLLRQRVAAARQLDDLEYRVRNLFPFPVALPWTRAMTASRDLEGYLSILQCAESLTGYMAVLSILLARSASHELGSVGALCTKLSSSPHGASMSDWTAIVREVAGKTFQTKVIATTPFVELTELMAEETPASQALRDLTQMRNDLAHNRGPKGAQVASSFDDAVAHLVQLYDACQWLCDYPVRLVEKTTWDSYSELGRYTYRELVGDHYLVPERHATTSVATLNAGSLYVVDRRENLHLVSPLILWHECDTCHLPSAFFIDGYDAQAGECRMRAMDHNHSISRRDVVRPLSTLGLLSL